MGPTLRDYQLCDLETLRAAMRGARKVLFVATVSYGKTELFGHIANAYAARGQTVLILSHRTSIVSQTIERIGGSPSIMISTVQGVVRRLDSIPRPSVVIVDEVHRGGAAAQYRRVYGAFPEARVLGFTGTPTRALFELFDAHVQGESAEVLTALGYIAPLRYVLPSRIETRRIRVVAGEFDDESAVAEMERAGVLGDAIASYRDNCVGSPTLLFTQNVKHARAVAEEFAAAGFPSEILIGKDKADEKDRKKEVLKAGGLVVAVDAITEGFSVSNLGAIIVLRVTRSAQLWVQILGRVARAAPGKTFGWVYDHGNNARRLGTLTEARDWRTEGDRPDPKTVTEDGDLLSIRHCGKCFANFATGPTACPFCDHDLGADTRISKATAAEMREVSEEAIRKARQLEREAREAEERGARTFEQLLELERRRGYGRGWARARWQARQRKRAA